MKELVNFINANFTIGKIKDITKIDDSTDGNVYLVEAIEDKYILKIYDTEFKANSMLKLYELLSELKIESQKFIEDKFLFYRGKYIILYSFVQGKQLKDILCNNKISDNDIKLIANYLKNLHRLTRGNKSNFILDAPFGERLNRKSILHFDITKDNIFIDDENAIFIDYDDSRYGASLIDVAIAISNLFISKKRGIDTEGIKLFLQSYYDGDIVLMNEELPQISNLAKKWINTTLENSNIESSTKESFNYKLKTLDKINLEKLMNE